MPANEPCAACGRSSGEAEHPVVLVVNRNHEWVNQAIAASRSGEWLAVPICKPCHLTPTSKMKGHFFYRGQAVAAVNAAGSNNLGMT